MDDFEKEIDNALMDNFDTFEEDAEDFVGNAYILPKNSKTRKALLKLFKELVKSLE